MDWKWVLVGSVMGMQVMLAGPQKVISYNIRYDSAGDKGVRDWGERVPRVVQFLKEQRPSVVGMQEVLENQLMDLEKRLPAYGWVGVGRTDGVSKGEYSPIFYDTSVWKVDEENTGTFWLSKSPEVPGSKSWGNRIPRICTWVRLIGNDGEGLTVYNTHWDHLSWISREKAAGLILEKIRQRKHKEEGYLLMGDLNTTTKSKAIKTLLESELLVDTGKKQKKSFNRWKADVVDGLRIDHIFVDPRLSKGVVGEGVEVVASSKEGSAPASDHHPVVMTVDFDLGLKVTTEP
ncbi:MAG: endonuclease/exonuclease/phosphatase family protein [Akkermansiaceae bacterium]